MHVPFHGYLSWHLSDQKKKSRLHPLLRLHPTKTLKTKWKSKWTDRLSPAINQAVESWVIWHPCTQQRMTRRFMTHKATGGSKVMFSLAHRKICWSWTQQPISKETTQVELNDFIYSSSLGGGFSLDHILSKNIWSEWGKRVMNEQIQRMPEPQTHIKYQLLWKHRLTACIWVRFKVSLSLICFAPFWADWEMQSMWSTCSYNKLKS